jgi:hypothetical protein
MYTSVNIKTSISGIPILKEIRLSRRRFLSFAHCLEILSASSFVTGVTEFNDAPQQYWQNSVPAGLGFLQIGQINHRPSGG